VLFVRYWKLLAFGSNIIGGLGANSAVSVSEFRQRPGVYNLDDNSFDDNDLDSTIKSRGDAAN